MRRKEREITSKEEIKEVLEASDCCRVAFAVDERPYIVCMNYGYEWSGELPVLYFHCAREGLKLDLMERNNLVCFQLDTGHELEYIPEKVYCTMNYSSIVGMGRLKRVEKEGERIRALDRLMNHHGHKAPKKYPEGSLARTTILRLDVSEITAKQKS